MDYNPYGEKLGSNSTHKRVDGYGGNIYDGETDYVPMGARWYLPEIGRFLSADPMWASFPALSPYVYANDNPMSFKDPSGLAPESEGKKHGNRTLSSGTLLYPSWESLDEWQRENTYSGLAEPSNGERIGMESAMEGNHVTLGLMDQMKGFGTFNYWMRELGIDGGGSNGVYTSCRSTIINKSGTVLDVIYDGSCDIVQIGNISKDQYKRDKYLKGDYIGTVVGETYFWNDFLDDKGHPRGTIHLNQSKDSWVDSFHNKGWSLFAVMMRSSSNGYYDIKSKPGVNAYDGYQFRGLKYTSIRNMGDFLAGWNGATSSQFGLSISLETFMRMAGAVHLTNNLSKFDRYNAIVEAFSGFEYAPAPFYGEVDPEGSYCIWGFMYGRVEDYWGGN